MGWGGGSRVVEVDGWEDELLLFGCWEDLVQVNGNAEGYEEEATDTGFDPVLWLEGWWCY